MLAEALLAAHAIEWEEARAEALGALAPHLAGLPRDRLYPLWRETLPLLAARTRRDLLSDLPALLPVILRLGGEAAVAETFRAVQFVGERWP